MMAGASQMTRASKEGEQESYWYGLSRFDIRVEGRILEGNIIINAIWVVAAYCISLMCQTNDF